MPEDVYDAYKEVERDIRAVLKSDRKAAQKLLSAYLNRQSERASLPKPPVSLGR